VTNVVRSAASLATLGIRVVSIVSARVIAGRMVVRWNASLDLSALGVGQERVMDKTPAARTVLHPMPQR
jgi:hypothetical protein